MIGLFSDRSTKNVKICFLGGVLICESTLEEGVHTYIYSDLISIDGLGCDVDDCYVFLRAQSNISLNATLVFFGGNKEKLSGGSSPANQAGKIEVPVGAAYFRIALRFMQAGSAEIFSFDIASLENINKIISESNSFHYKDLEVFSNDYRSKVSLKSPLIVIETIFCDTEKNSDVLFRYLSYFVGLISCVGAQNYGNFIWFIHVSSDKGCAIDVIRSAIERVGLGSRVYLNIYTHPKEGYGNEGEVHIDRIRRPNATYPERRDNLFSSAIKGAGFYESSELEDCVVIRVALDDDDFITRTHFETLQSLGLEHSKKIDEKLLTVIISLNRIFVSHFMPNGKVDTFDVEFSRALTGCKFSVSVGDYPRSAFSISERFDEVDQSRPEVLYVECVQNEPSFSYNRHGGNLSGQNKNFYFKKEYGALKFSSHAQMINEFSKR